jgi:hypothetical protein
MDRVSTRQRDDAGRAASLRVVDAGGKTDAVRGTAAVRIVTAVFTCLMKTLLCYWLS